MDAAAVRASLKTSTMVEVLTNERQARALGAVPEAAEVKASMAFSPIGENLTNEGQARAHGRDTGNRERHHKP